MIDSSIQNLKSLIEARESGRNPDWAHAVCTASRFIHVYVWRECPPREYVKSEVVPLLKEAEKAIRVLADSGAYDEETEHVLGVYADNDALRIKNIEENYLLGRLSAFRPEEKIKELGELVR